MRLEGRGNETMERGIDHATYRTTPNIKLLDNRSARGSDGSEMRSHNCVISAVRTERFGSFLKEDRDPSVAANLSNEIRRGMVFIGEIKYQRRPKPLSRLERSSGVKNIAYKIFVHIKNESTCCVSP